MAQSLQPIPITISGPTPWIDVKAYGAVGDGSHDDSGAIQAAINACPSSGCTIYFGSSSSSSSAYLISTGLAIPSDSLSIPQGIRLLGECGAPGPHDPSETCSHLVTPTGMISPFVMLTAGVTATTNKLRGLVIQDLGFQDQSSNRAVTGAIRLVNTESFNLTNVHCRGISNGYCMQFDGGDNTDPHFTQFGVVVNPSADNVKFPVQTNFRASEISFFGGNLVCNNLDGSIGMDLGATNHTQDMVSYQTGGEWGVFGTHIMNCVTGISMFNSSNINYFGIMEQTPDSNKSGTGIVIDGDIAGKPSKSILAGSINNFVTGVLLDHEAVNNRILANISNTTNPIVIGGSAISTTLPSTLILTTSNYAGGGTAIGTQIPTDITMPAEAKPAQPATSSRRLYADSGAGNDLSVERSDGTAVDLEAASKLLNYQKPGSIITGNNSDQTVYTFSVPSIPPGKGIRARVFWACIVSHCGAAKTFKWQFGSTTASYASFASSLLAPAYTEVRIFNDPPSSQSSQVLFGDAISVGATLQSAGIITALSQDTSTAKSLTFIFNATTTEQIIPEGFIVEVIQ